MPAELEERENISLFRLGSVDALLENDWSQGMAMGPRQCLVVTHDKWKLSLNSIFIMLYICSDC